jgi:hypothetical protein
MNQQLLVFILPSTMRLRSIAAVLAASLLSCACVIVPVTIESFDPDCRVVTRHMELQAVQLQALNSCNGNGCQTYVLVGLGLTAASAIISGSIAITGNVVYWAEHRASCPAPVAVPIPPPATS